VQGNGAWTDLIDDFMLYTQDYQSSEVHRTWSAITLVGGACERRIWVDVGPYETYANLYVFLVAPPGYGKGIIEVVKDLWLETKDPDHRSGGGNGKENNAFHVAPDNVTRASLIDDLAEAKSVRILENINPLKNQTSSPSLIYHTLLIPAEEFEVLLPAYDPSFMSVLNSIWNNKAVHSETRRHGPAKDVTIPNPQFTIIGGVQPAYFVSHFPDVAWDTGLARRIIMVYSDSVPKKDPWYKTPGRKELRDNILRRLGYISAQYGRMRVNKEAENLVREWDLADGPPTPTHSKLVHYNRSRTQLLIKLSMIAAISRTGEIIIQGQDVTRALGWLLEAERRMPDIFRAMTGKSDSQILEELHYFVIAKYRESNKPVDSKHIYEFLSFRATSDKLDSLILTAEKTQRMVRVGNGQSWMPRPKFVHGVE
jgi:hypothetical protein